MKRIHYFLLTLFLMGSYLVYAVERNGGTSGSAAAGSGDLTSITSGDGTLSVTNGTGPDPDITLNLNSNNRWTAPQRLSTGSVDGAIIAGSMTVIGGITCSTCDIKAKNGLFTSTVTAQRVEASSVAYRYLVPLDGLAPVFITTMNACFTFYMNFGLPGATTAQICPSSITFQDMALSTTASDLIQFAGYDSFGISTNIINVSSATGMHNRVVLPVDGSSPTNNVVMKAYIPPNRNPARDPISRYFEISNASTTGALVAFEANSQLLSVTFATASPNVVPTTGTFSNPVTFTVPGGSAPGGVRRVTDQTLTGIGAVIGKGGCDLYMKFTAANPGVNTIIRNLLMETFASQ